MSSENLLFFPYVLYHVIRLRLALVYIHYFYSYQGAFCGLRTINNNKTHISAVSFFFFKELLLGLLSFGKKTTF